VVAGNVLAARERLVAGIDGAEPSPVLQLRAYHLAAGG